MPSAHAGTSSDIWKNGVPSGRSDQREAAEQLDDAEQRDQQRPEVERPPRRRQLEREGDEDLAAADRHPLPPGQPRHVLLVQPAAEEAVGVARVVREEPLQVLGRQIAGVGVEQLPRAIGA